MEMRMAYIYAVYVKGQLVGYRADSVWSIYPLAYAKRYEDNWSNQGQSRLERVKESFEFLWKEITVFSVQKIFSGATLADIEIKEQQTLVERNPRQERLIRMQLKI
jgi:hypothetical protein